VFIASLITGNCCLKIAGLQLDLNQEIYKKQYTLCLAERRGKKEKLRLTSLRRGERPRDIRNSLLLIVLIIFV